jgi:hypothetical protein
MDAHPGMGGPTSYMKDLTDKLAFLRVEILSKYNVGELGQTWYESDLARMKSIIMLHQGY